MSTRRQFESCLTLDVNELLRRGGLAHAQRDQLGGASRRRGVVGLHGRSGSVWLRLRFSTPLENGTRRQVDQRVTLAHGEHSPERVNQRNGYRDRPWETRAKLALRYALPTCFAYREPVMAGS